MLETKHNIFLGDCLIRMNQLEKETIDLAYLDPPFFTNRIHFSSTRDRNTKFSFSDTWNNLSDYIGFMEKRIQEVHRVLKNSGSIFVHCDTNANFILRALLDNIFGPKQFRSEIIWYYKRWSNSAKGLLPAHQTILFYSKSSTYKFNKIYTSYSETTNIDQILQLRSRDSHGVSVYATNTEGEVINCKDKKGVPLSDVWEIPFLNPKAKERTGYPTQKPILLLERIIDIVTEPGDLILDPFCGSGTTLVAAKINQRNSIGIDSSEEAVKLSQKRLITPEKTESALLKLGRLSYDNADKSALSLLQGLDILPVHRNTGIDAFIRINSEHPLVPIKIQKQNESLYEAAEKLNNAANKKKYTFSILVRTHDEIKEIIEVHLPQNIYIIEAPKYSINNKISRFLSCHDSDSNKISKVKKHSIQTLV